MIVNVWLIYKRGADRIYTRTTQPTESDVKSYKEEGHEIFLAEIDLPVDDGVEAVILATAKPAEVLGDSQ